MTKVLCPYCDTALIVYRPKKIRFKEFLQFRYYCLDCPKAFLLPSWVIVLFIGLLTLFCFYIEFSNEDFFLVLFEPVINLVKTERISLTVFIWLVGILSILISLIFSYLVILLGIKFMMRQLIEISISALDGWVVFRQKSKKEELKTAWVDIKKFPLWQKVIAIIFISAVVTLVVMIYQQQR